MRPRSAAILAIRIIALVIGIEAITSIVALIASTSQFGDYRGTGAFWTLIIVRLVIAIALWRFAEDFSRPMSQGTDEEPPMVARRTANVAAVAFSVIGLFVITEAVTDFVATLASSVRIGSQSPLSGLTFTGPGFLSGRGAAIIVEIVQFAIGLTLIIQSGNLARYLSRLYPEAEPPQQAPPGSTPHA